MMNVNENKELKQTQTISGFGQTVALPEGYSFKEEFEKLADNVQIAPQIYPFELMVDFSDTENADIFTIDTKKIENVDAMFFLNVSSNAQNINLQINDDMNIVDASNYKTMEVSKTLADIIMQAQENNKAVRLDFDNRVTVVLKVSKDGKIDTTFFPQEKEVENYLKNNIDYLKLRFDEQNIAYSNISYKPYKQARQNNNNNNNNNNNQGEKADE